MRRYTIVYLDAHGAAATSSVLQCDCDDDVIEIVGQSTHPHAIDIFETDRRVARCPALNSTYPFGPSEVSHHRSGASR
jgi:hypothetical protein